MTTMEDKFIRHLRRTGRNLTAERRQILGAALSFSGHFDIEDLFDKLKRKRNRISRATIYRAVPLLLESGMIREAMRCQSRVLYEPSYGHEHHDHLVCVNCGAVFEFKDDRIEQLQNQVCKRYGFTPVEHKLGIKGYCKKCRARKRVRR